MRTTLYLTRHGETQWNVEERMQGWRDSPLTTLGIQQATWLRDALKQVDFEAIYSSSSVRAQRTAEIIRYERTCELISCDALREIHMGDWEGKTRQEVQQKQLAAYTAFWDTSHLYRPENGGESYYDLQGRVVPLVDTLVARYEGGALLIVTHAGPLKLMMTHFEGRPLADLWHPPIVYSTALCKVVVEDKRYFIELYGDVSHYQEASEGWRISGKLLEQ